VACTSRRISGEYLVWCPVRIGGERSRGKLRSSTATSANFLPRSANGPPVMALDQLDGPPPALKPCRPTTAWRAHPTDPR